jgi:GNAT superfamily N-acetyltransferase
MSMAEVSSSPNGLLADDAERAPVALRIQSLDFSHHFQRILSSLDQSSLRHRVGPSTRDDCPTSMQTASLATAPRFFGVFVGQSLQGILELYDGEASGHVEVTLVVERPWRNKGLGWAVLGAAVEWVRHSQTRTIRMVFSRDNWPMRALAHKANAQLTLVFDEIYASITVMPNPTYQVGTATDLDVNRNATGEVACARARLHGTTSSCRRQTSARLIAG